MVVPVLMVALPTMVVVAAAATGSKRQQSHQAPCMLPRPLVLAIEVDSRRGAAGWPIHYMGTSSRVHHCSCNGPWLLAIELADSCHPKEALWASTCQQTFWHLLSQEKLICQNATKCPFHHPPAVSPVDHDITITGWFGNVRTWSLFQEMVPPTIQLEPLVPARLATPGPQIQSQTRICVSQRTQQRGCRPKVGTDFL